MLALWMMDKNLMGKDRTTRISDLPEEVLTEVLVRLSIKDILACMSVKKSWCSLIKTPMFKNLYSSNYQKITNLIPNNKKYLLFWDTDTHSKAHKIRVDDIQFEVYLTLKYPPDLSKHRFHFGLVSNGLICLFDKVFKTRQDIYLWNPVIQKYKTLPNSPPPPSSCRFTRWKAIAFGFVPEINDYLVVYMAKYGIRNKPHIHSIITCVYSLSTNSWRQRIYDGDSNSIIYSISQCDSVFVNGVAVWVGGDSVLVCFDTKTQMLRQIRLPVLFKRRNFNIPVIHAIDQSIAYFVERDCYFDGQLDVWVLKGDPMNEFVWEKKMVKVPKVARGSIMGVRNNDKPVLWHAYDLTLYNIDSPKSYKFDKSWDRWTPLFSEDERDDECSRPFVITPFEESLGLLDIDCTQYY